MWCLNYYNSKNGFRKHCLVSVVITILWFNVMNIKRYQEPNNLIQSGDNIFEKNKSLETGLNMLQLSLEEEKLNQTEITTNQV